jgi:hypothetical protein
MGRINTIGLSSFNRTGILVNAWYATYYTLLHCLYIIVIIIGSNLDWIGIYDSGKIGIVSRPKSWLYLLTCPYDEKRRLVVEFQPLNEGVYKVGYFCAKKKCLQALSNSFNVRKLFY